MTLSLLYNASLSAQTWISICL